MYASPRPVTFSPCAAALVLGHPAPFSSTLSPTLGMSTRWSDESLACARRLPLREYDLPFREREYYTRAWYSFTPTLTSPQEQDTFNNALGAREGGFPLLLMPLALLRSKPVPEDGNLFISNSLTLLMIPFYCPCSCSCPPRPCLRLCLRPCGGPVRAPRLCFFFNCHPLPRDRRHRHCR